MEVSGGEKKIIAIVSASALCSFLLCSALTILKTRTKPQRKQINEKSNNKTTQTSSEIEKSEKKEKIKEPQQEEPKKSENIIISNDVDSQQHAKLIELIGKERFEKLHDKYVLIVGLGGLGSHAANCLVRSGIKKLRLIDFDQVTLSSLNRHAVATRVDVGKPKALVLKKYLSRVNSNVEIEAIRQIFTKENSFSLIFGRFNGEECDSVIESDRRPDFVIDCIDNVPTKVELLYFCKINNIPVITTAGAGCKIDPTRLRICDLQETCYDPLLRATRVRLNSKYKIKEGIPCVFSNERPPVKLLPLIEEQEDDPHSFQTLPDIYMRVRIVPVLGPMPAIYGNIIAMEIVRILSGLSSATVQKVDKRQKKFYMKMIHKLNQFEKRYFPGQKFANRATLSEVEYVVQELFHGKSAFLDSEVFRTKLVIVRWDKSKPPSFNNIVPLSLEEAQKHYNHEGFSAWPGEFVEKVNAILQSASMKK